MFYRRLRGRLSLLFLISLELGCEKKATGLSPRYAIVRFENLSGDRSLDWTGRAASELLPTMLAGAMDGPVLNPGALSRVAPALGERPPAAPGISSERSAAILAGATRLISGYVERTGSGMRMTAVVENLSNGKNIQTVSVNETGAPSAALVQLAHLLSDRAKAFPNAGSDAVRLYAIGLESSPDAGRNDFEQAVRIDPDFGPPWLALARLEVAKGERDSAETTIAQALRQKLDPLTVANLEAEEASLNGNQTARLSAMKRIGALSPGDTQLVRSLADSELRAGQFADAASDWKKLADLLPNDGPVWNSLGYARSYAGDFAGAMAAFQEYVRLAPGDSNPLDSIGDLDYAYRRFGDAAARYLEANGKDPNFQQGGELYKAAWAKYSAGDKVGADQLFARFAAARAKSSNTLLPLIAADWLYRTGRAAQAASQLRQAVSDTKSAALRADGYSQLAIWDLLAGDRAKAAMDAKPAAGPANVVWAIMRFATLPSASAAEWKARAEQTIPSPAMVPLRRLAQGYALLLDGKREAALPVWKEIAGSAPGTDFFTRAIYARLQGKPLSRALLPDPNSVNQFAGLLDSL